MYEERDNSGNRGGRRDDVRSAPLTTTEVPVGRAGDQQGGRGHAQSLGHVAPRRLGRHPLREQRTPFEIGQRVLERRDLVPQVEVHASRVRRARQPAAPGNGECVTPWGRQPPIGEQSIPRNLAHTVHSALYERARLARADGGQFHVYQRGMGGDDGERDARGPRVHTGRLDRSDGDGERAALGLTESRELGGCEEIRIEFCERIPFNGGPEIQHGGVALPGEGETGAQILVRFDPLLLRHLERPVGRHDLAQQRQRALHFEPFVELVGLP